MDLSVSDVIALLNLVILVVMFLGPPLLIGTLYMRDRLQTQHAVLRNFPLLGRIRYLLEHVGPELRQYLFDSDREGKPFSRDEYMGVVFAGKYLKSLMSFGSKRDFSKPGWYLRNAIIVTQNEDLHVEREPKVLSQRYAMVKEGLFSRSERREPVEMSHWTLPPEQALVIGGALPNPWRLTGLIGMSAMSYGALGRNAIQAMSYGLGMARGSWVNTGEGGLSEHHLVGGADVVYQIGPGLFGVRGEGGDWSWEEFQKKASIPEVRAFELKLHQGAKIRGGHVEGAKVTEEIAAIRGVPVGQTIDSPNRFPMFDSLETMLDWIDLMRARSGKPVGLKLVVGGPGSIDPLAEAIARREGGPDWITVDGGEGGSGATFREMADSVGVPIRSAIVEVDDALRRQGIRDRVRLFASGMLFSPDRIAIALSLGADAVCIARGLMISVGCIQAQKCHSNTCPVGVATTDERLMRALVIDEKKYRVLNYMVTLRAALSSLVAAAGLKSPLEFRRTHAVYKDEHGRIQSAEDLFPYPLPVRDVLAEEEEEEKLLDA